MSADGVNGKQNITKSVRILSFQPTPLLFVLSHAYLQTKRNDCDKMADDEKTSNAPITDPSHE